MLLAKFPVLRIRFMDSGAFNKNLLSHIVLQWTIHFMHRLKNKVLENVCSMNTDIITVHVYVIFRNIKNESCTLILCKWKYCFCCQSCDFLIYVNLIFFFSWRYPKTSWCPRLHSIQVPSSTWHRVYRTPVHRSCTGIFIIEMFKTVWVFFFYMYILND